MFKAIIHDKQFEIKPGKSAKVFILNNEEVIFDLIKIKEGSFHIICNYSSYNIEVISANPDEKYFELRINGNMYHVHLKDRYDELIHALGMDAMNSKKADDLKAPMPGLVTDIRVAEGQTIKKDDILVTLEAMKMENTLKAAADGVVRKVAVIKGAVVEKNEVLIYLQ